MHAAPTSSIPTSHLLLTFGLAGPPVGFIATVTAVTALIPTPEGIAALAYALNPLGLALIYAAGLAPALATAGVLTLFQDRGHRPSLITASITGFIISLAYGMVATATAFLPKPALIALALGVVGALAAAICLLIARQIPKILAATPEAG